MAINIILLNFKQRRNRLSAQLVVNYQLNNCGWHLNCTKIPQVQQRKQFGCIQSIHNYTKVCIESFCR